MKVYTLDFESYYDPEYSLSKMSTEDYVFDQRFEIICVSVRTPTGNLEVYTGDEAGTKAWLLQFNLHQHAVCAHNERFDGLILERLGIRPAFHVDTLSMARPLLGSKLKSLSLASLVRHFRLGEKGDEVVRAIGKRRADFTPQEMHEYIKYCAKDTDLCYKLYRILRDMMPDAATELNAIDQTLRMYLQPVLRLDGDALHSNLRDVQARKAKVLAELEVSGVTGDLLRSNDKFAELLRSRGIDPPMKVSKKKTETAGHTVMTYAFAKTDPEFIELQEEFAEDLEMTMILNGRISEKSTQEETRTTKLLNIADRYGFLRVPLAYAKAHTHRYGGDEGINMQNPPRVDKSRMRYAILPPEDHVMMVADLAQIEARETAMLAGQMDLVEDFRAGKDVYSGFATELYGDAPGVINKKSTDQAIQKKRFVGKECLSGETMILCERGTVRLDRVTKEDRVWDGVEWVEHLGLVSVGIRETLCLSGVWLTPDHLVWSGTAWVQAQHLVLDGKSLFLALAHAAENLPCAGMSSVTGAAYSPSSCEESLTLSRRLPVYDLLSAGPRSRFTIVTVAGPLIVHNSILGLGFGMAAERFRAALRGKAGLVLPIEETERYVQFYRARFPAIPGLWKRFEFAFKALMMYGTETDIGPAKVCFGPGDVPRILGPNGMSLWYPNLKFHGYDWTFQRPSHKVPQKVFGGKWTENTAQFLANIIIKQKMVRIRKELDLLPRLQAHDAIGWVVPKSQAEEYAGAVERIMSEPPVWWPDLPVAAEVKVGATYGDV